VINENDRSGFKEAKAIARQAEVVILAIGEDSQQSGEGRSQADIGLAGLQQELLEEIYAVNRNIIVVLMNGRPLAITWMAEHVPAIVEAWHLGSEAGNAIADVLFGDFNPSGRLPVTFPRSIGQVPVYYAHKNTGRPGPLENEVFWSHYTDEINEPLFPFGFGLSYTTFSYSDINLSAEEIAQDQTLEVAVKVTNTGEVRGREVVQLYIRDLVASETRPVRELKAFKLADLDPGQSQRIAFKLDGDDLSFFSSNGEKQLEPGAFHVFVGSNSRDVKQAEFRLSDGKHKEKL
jgi:beta-glucosidase